MLGNGFNHAYATYVLKWFVINHHDFLQDVLSPGLSVLFENKTQSQEYIFCGCLCGCGSDSGNIVFLFFFKICVCFLLVSSDNWNTKIICCKMTVYGQASVHCALIFLEDRLKLRRKKSWSLILQFRCVYICLLVLFMILFWAYDIISVVAIENTQSLSDELHCSMWSLCYFSAWAKISANAIKRWVFGKSWPLNSECNKQ